MAAEQNVFQKVAEATHNVVTPANAMDAAAFALAVESAPRLDTWRGIIKMAVSYLTDLGDGATARATGTVREVGAGVDAAGDKIKTAYVGYQVARRGQADYDLLAVFGAYNLATAGATVYDRLAHDKPKIEASIPGKRAMFAGALALGLQIIGNKVAETDETKGRAIKLVGTGVGYGGLAHYGVPAVRDYWRKARS
jgi:phosphatidylglycerophosphate synthase